MRATHSLARWCWAALALGTFGLQAQDTGLSTSFKVRGGLQIASNKDGLDNRLLGFGLELGFDAGAGRVVGELGYLYKSGSAYRTDLTQVTAAPTATIDYSASVESRKTKADGIYLRVGYQVPLQGDWGAQAGLQFGGNRFSLQYTGQVSGTTNPENVTTPIAYTDSYIGVPTKSSLTPSPYAGVTYAIDKFSKLELGVILYTYKALNYQHVAGTVANQNGGHISQDTLGEQSRMLPHIEAAYVFRF